MLQASKSYSMVSSLATFLRFWHTLAIAASSASTVSTSSISAFPTIFTTTWCLFYFFESTTFVLFWIKSMNWSNWGITIFLYKIMNIGLEESSYRRKMWKTIMVEYFEIIFNMELVKSKCFDPILFVSDFVLKYLREEQVLVGFFFNINLKKDSMSSV